MRLLSFAVSGLLALAVPVPSHAQSGRPIEVPAGAPWKHGQTGITLPVTLLGVARDMLVDNSGSQIDVIAGYGDGQTTTITLFVFHPALASVPMWFDRSDSVIMLRDVYGNPTPASEPVAFAPPNGKATSALRRTYAPGKGPYRSTGLAIIPIRDWLVAIRISSQQDDPAALERKLEQVIGALGWPENVPEADIAVPVAPCAAPLTYAKKARLKAPDLSDAILGAALANLTPTDKEKAEAKPITWCREGTGTINHGVYRATRMDGGYVIAMGDAGKVIDVTPGVPLLSKDPGYRLSVEMLDRTLIYPSFDKLPSPDVAIEAVMKSAPLSSSTRGGKDINISVGATKAK